MDLFCKLWFIFSLSIPVCSQFAGILKASVQIYDFIDSINSNDPKPLTKADADYIIKELSEEIQTSETNIIRSSVMQSRLERIDDAVIQIKNSLQDLTNYLNSSTSTRDSFKSIFIVNYENGEITSKLRFLPTLLTYQNPAQKGTLLSLLAANSRCILTTVDIFKTFYNNLMSSGISINVAYDFVKFNMSKEAALKEWINTSRDIEEKFQTVENHCQSLFTTYATKDLNEAVSAHALHIKNNAWNPWKKNDVFFSKSYGTHQFVYLEYEDDTVIWQRTDTNDKVAVFYQPYLYEYRLPSNILTDSTERFRSTIDGEDDDSAAKHVAQSVENMLNQDGYIVESLVVLFDDGESEEALDIDTPAVKATIDDVKLTYCYENRVQCSIDVLDSTKSASGSFKIYVYAHYPNATIQHSKHHIGAADKLANISDVLFLVATFLTTFTDW
ncbi:uncharacterized protein LOC123541539 [Mercenaria mercenaria]|uniref:uncharacterized protein LOC123541539 n=1 Tax=Mercenaria mercenaria TaxID=6596 RepID=UPI00234EA75C|nr:uncharacterized protein LOC123541539 [Mercenaria mercenaria]